MFQPRTALNRGRALALLAVALSSATDARCADVAAAGEAPRVLAIESVAVVDVVRGSVVAPRTVVVIDGRITMIAEAGAIDLPPHAQRVDGRSRYLIPGLVDMHVHLFNNSSGRPPNDWAFPLFIANGVTGVREMAAKASDLPTVSAWRTALAQGRLIAPHVLAAGVVVQRPSWDNTQQQVRDARRAGADFVKVFSEVREPVWRRLLHQARTERIPVCGHVPAGVRLLHGARAGQRSNEHLSQVYEACSAAEERFVRSRVGLEPAQIVNWRDMQEREVLEQFDTRACDITAAALATTGQAQVPTLVLANAEARESRTAFEADARWPYLRPDEQERWRGIFREQGPLDPELALLRLRVSLAIVGRLHAAGVRILAGSDAPMPLVYPGFALHKELELLVEAGVSAADALRSATMWPADFLRRSDRSGSVEVGKRADLVLLDGDPLQDISNTQRIHAVVLNGRLLTRSDLTALLAPAPKMNRQLWSR
jgi:imidazolonepropionase-like amidohydrolase